MVKRFTWIWMTVVLSVFTVNLHAQDWKSIITGIASAVGDKVTEIILWKEPGSMQVLTVNFQVIISWQRQAENWQPRR